MKLMRYNIIQQTDDNDTGLQFADKVLLPFLKIGAIRAFFQFQCTYPELMLPWNNMFMVVAIN